MHTCASRAAQHRTFPGSSGSNQSAFASRAAAPAAAAVGDTASPAEAGLLRFVFCCRGLRRGVRATAGVLADTGAFAGVPLLWAGPAGEPPTARGLRRGVASAAAHSVADGRPLPAMPPDRFARARDSGDARISTGVLSGKEGSARAVSPPARLSLLGLPVASSFRRAASATCLGAPSACAEGGAGAEVRRICGCPPAACASAAGSTGGA